MKVSDKKRSISQPKALYLRWRQKCQIFGRGSCVLATDCLKHVAENPLKYLLGYRRAKSLRRIFVCKNHKFRGRRPYEPFLGKRPLSYSTMFQNVIMKKATPFLHTFKEKQHDYHSSKNDCNILTTINIASVFRGSVKFSIAHTLHM